VHCSLRRRTGRGIDGEGYRPHPRRDRGRSHGGERPTIRVDGELRDVIAVRVWHVGVLARGWTVMVKGCSPAVIEAIGASAPVLGSIVY